MSMMQTDIARAKRLHRALTQGRSVLVSELSAAESRHRQLIKRAERFDPLAGPDAQQAQQERIGELRRQLDEHDAAAVAKLKQRTAGVRS